MKDLAQLVLCFGESFGLFCGKAGAGAIDVKIEHGHRRLIWAGFAPPAALGGSFERKSNLTWIALFENAVFQVECVTFTGHGGRPFAALLSYAHRSMAFKKLDLSFVAFGGFQGLKSPKISPFARFRVALARIKPVSAVFEFSNHKSWGDIRVRAAFRPAAASRAGPFVRTALCAARDRSEGLRRREAE